jgi:hypothetical protein
VNLIRLLFAVGILLSCGWLYFYAYSTVLFIYQVLNNEFYYFDIVPFYLLPYAITPFAAALYVKGLKQESKKNKLPKKQRFIFGLLTCFALLQLFESVALFYAFFSTFTKFEFTLEWLWLFLPIGFLTFFFVLVRYLYQTRNSFKSIQAT